MAALDRKITISTDYRPCIVHIPAVTRNRRQDFNVYLEVVEPEKDIKALFHAQRKNHRLPEWRMFCDWIKTLPYSFLITGEENNE